MNEEGNRFCNLCPTPCVHACMHACMRRTRIQGWQSRSRQLHLLPTGSSLPCPRRRTSRRCLRRWSWTPSPQVGALESTVLWTSRLPRSCSPRRTGQGTRWRHCRPRPRARLWRWHTYRHQAHRRPSKRCQQAPGTACNAVRTRGLEQDVGDAPAAHGPCTVTHAVHVSCLCGGEALTFPACRSRSAPLCCQSISRRRMPSQSSQLQTRTHNENTNIDQETR